MLRSVYGETLWSRRASLAWYVVGLGVLVGITTGVYPTVRDGADTFTQLLESMPQGMMSFFGSSDITELLSPSGFVNSRINASIGAIVLSVFAISLGTGAVAGEEDRRTMDLLLATPTSRHSLVLQRFAATWEGLTDMEKLDHGGLGRLCWTHTPARGASRYRSTST